MAGLVVAALTAGLLGTMTQARRARAQAARADQEARAASRQRDFAIRQLSRAEAVNDLNRFVLSDAAPLGKPFTAGELLARAERIALRQQGDADENRIDTLVSIGRQYQMQDDDGKARSVLAKAYELSRTSADPSTRAQAACSLAHAVSAAGEGERAEQLLKEADGILPKESLYALDRVFCLMRGSEVAEDRGDGRTGVERAEKAARLAKESGLASELLEHNVTMRLAESYRLAGRFREARAAFEKGFERLAALGRDDTETAGTLLNNWGLTLRSMGQTLEAERLFRRAIQISSADGTEERVSPMLLNNLARTLSDLERLSEAADYAGRAYAKARQTGHEGVVNFSLLARAVIYRQQGDLRRSAEMLSELESRAKRMWPAGHIGLAAIATERAELARARGDLSTASSETDRAIALAEASTQQPEFLRRLLLRRSAIRLELHRPDQARADAEAALRLEMAAVGPGTPCSNVGLAQLALGRALQAQAKHQEARAAFASAAEQLAPTLGAEHPATRRARELAAAPYENP